jgi:hypothetical protein
MISKYFLKKIKIKIIILSRIQLNTSYKIISKILLFI